MTKIDLHIGRLLYAHNCVILPGFGGFVTSYAGAKLQVIQQQVFPPRKHISFNKHLQTSDGLLANALVQQLGLTFGEAEKLIGRYVEDLQFGLRRGDRVVLEGIGYFLLQSDGTLIFEPSNEVNYLPDAFGLHPVHALPIVRTVNEPVVEETIFKDRPPVPLKSRKPTFKRKWITNMAAAVFVGVSLFIIGTPFVQQVLRKNSYASLNPFAHIQALQQSPTPAPIHVTKIDTLKVETLPPPSETVVQPAVQVPEKEITTPQQADPVLPFHLICGCFKVEENAENFIRQLADKNVKARIIGKNKFGLFMVAGGDFENKDDAYAAMNAIKAKQIPSWVFTN